MSIPQPFLCPITMEVMKEPWMDSDGNSYEKEAIFQWVQVNQNSPITRNPMSLSNLVPNRALKELIEKFLKTNTLSPPDITTNITDGEKSHLTSNGPTNIIMIADTSGSMGETCDNHNQTEKMGFTRLDLVKHTMNTIVESLSPDDMISLVEFNYRAKALTKLVNASRTNKTQMKEMISNLKADGGTNIWDALRVSLELSKQISSKVEILLFTDGESNENPPRGIVQTLVDYIQTNKTNVSIHTYGFGNNINSKLLYEISSEKNGMFGFIPDSTMIGTVFINSLSYLMTNKHTTCFDKIDEEIRLNFVQFLNRIISSEQNTIPSFISYVSPKNTPFSKALLVDCVDSYDNDNGQISKAINPVYFETWGKHYLYSVLSAYQNKMCLNFKDNGVQHFKTSVFEQVQKFIENIFINLPPPIPSTKPYSAPISSFNFSQSFYNQRGGCFTNATLLNTVNGLCPAKNITKGTNVITDTGIATVICVVKFKFDGEICKFKTTGITPFHPVYFENKEWIFPNDSTIFEKEYYDGYVYDFVLDKHHVIKLNGINAVTLGHNFVGPVVEHDYFGNKIINDLKKCNGWDNGYIELENWEFIRGGDMKVCGLKF